MVIKLSENNKIATFETSLVSGKEWSDPIQSESLHLWKNVKQYAEASVLQTIDKNRCTWKQHSRKFTYFLSRLKRITIIK